VRPGVPDEAVPDGNAPDGAVPDEAVPDGNAPDADSSSSAPPPHSHADDEPEASAVLRGSRHLGVKRRRSYRTRLEGALVLALLLVVALLNAPIDFREEAEWAPVGTQEVVQMKDVMPTKQAERRPPRPPSPAPPVAVPNDQVVDVEIDFDASLDLDEALDVAGAPTGPTETAGPPAPEEEDNGEPEIFIVVEDNPVLVGGYDGLYERIRYPEFARQAGIQGRVIVQFVVSETGAVTNATTLQSPHRLLTEEALRVIQTATFEPGRQRNRPVKVRMTIPIVFRLQ
jgi:protein TonB